MVYINTYNSNSSQLLVYSVNRKDIRQPFTANYDYNVVLLLIVFL